MEDQHFEQVIDLKDKPSVRRNRTPEMDQMYKQQTFNHLFSIDEDAPGGRKSCNRKTMIWISAATILILATMVVLLLMVVGPKDQNVPSTDESRVNNKYNGSELDSMEKPTKHIPTKAPDPDKVSHEPSPPTATAPPNPRKTASIETTSSEFLKTSRKLESTTLEMSTPVISTAPPHSSEAYFTILSELSTRSFAMTTLFDDTMEFTTKESKNVCPVETSTDTTGCLISPLELCRSPGACQTFFPNRFDKGKTPSVLQKRYTFFNKMLSNFTCHPQAEKFTCSLLSPSCPMIPAEGTQMISESNYAFDVVNFPISFTNVPCSSLCTKIGAECNLSTSDGWTELCQSMPESPSSEICFGGNDKSVSLCRSSPCFNGGICLTKDDEFYCKCPSGYFGRFCNKTKVPGTNITKGECVSVTEQCQSVLPYNTTRGLNLNNTNYAFLAPFDSISDVVHGKEKIKRLFCGLFYPQCEDSVINRYTVCRELCQNTKTKVEFVLASLGFPSLQCDQVALDKDVERIGWTCI